MLSANVIVGIASVVMIVFVVVGRARGLSWPTVIIRCALIGAVALILAVTLFPIPIDARSWRFHRPFSNLHLSPFATIRTQLAFGLRHSEAREVVGNVALFVPLGFLLPAAARACRRPWVALSAAAGLSVLIEAVQGLLPSHATDVDDVILNTAGAVLGFFAFSLISWTVRRGTAPEPDTLREPAASSAG
jgi:glycopeptide antibiotics resistance protein